MPFASSVQKLARAATSPALSSRPRPERFDHAATHCKLERIIAEQTEMAGTAAGRDARRDGNHASLRRILAQSVEVGGGAASSGVR